MAMYLAEKDIIFQDIAIKLDQTLMRKLSHYLKYFLIIIWEMQSIEDIYRDLRGFDGYVHLQESREFI